MGGGLNRLEHFSQEIEFDGKKLLLISWSFIFMIYGDG
jgi:hypothetical protein